MLFPTEAGELIVFFVCSFFSFFLNSQTER